MSQELEQLKAAPGPGPWYYKNWPVGPFATWNEVEADPQNWAVELLDHHGKTIVTRGWYDTVHFVDEKSVIATNSSCDEIQLLDLESGEWTSQRPNNLMLHNGPLEVVFAASNDLCVWGPPTGSYWRKPIRWFFDTDPDLGYEWITTVVRTERSGHFIGGGFRIPVFLLSSDGDRLEGFVRGLNSGSNLDWTKDKLERLGY